VCVCVCVVLLLILFLIEIAVQRNRTPGINRSYCILITVCLAFLVRSKPALSDRGIFVMSSSQGNAAGMTEF
jgi:hypothetical protein